jgi:hypothetical protein
MICHHFTNALLLEHGYLIWLMWQATNIYYTFKQQVRPTTYVDLLVCMYTAGEGLNQPQHHDHP